MTSNRVTVNIHVRGSGSDGSPGRYLPGANHQETVQALEKVGFRKTADMTAISVTLDGDVEQRYYLPDADFGEVVRALRKAGFDPVADDPSRKAT